MEVWRKNVTLFIEDVSVNGQMVCLYLCDGRSISLPVSKFSCFDHATRDELRDFHITDDAQGINWPLLNQVITLERILSLTNSAF